MYHGILIVNLPVQATHHELVNSFIRISPRFCRHRLLHIKLHHCVRIRSHLDHRSKNKAGLFINCSRVAVRVCTLHARVHVHMHGV